MEKYKATTVQAKGRLLRERVALGDALRTAAWQLARAREDLATLQGWLVAGEATTAIAPVLLAEQVHQYLSRAYTLALEFAELDAWDEAMATFMEEARRQAADYLEERP